MVRMTPHAIADSYTPVNGFANGSCTPPRLEDLNGHGVQNLEDGNKIHRSNLRETPADELHDLICVGFGPAALAIAVALHDSLECSSPPSELSSLHGRLPKVAFLEKQETFAWHAGMLLEGAKMQISFIKDMATLRNPRSEFTFLNYLHENGRLVAFTNLSTFLPTRIEYEDYMRWCAAWFDDVVGYGQQVVDVIPEKRFNGGKTVDSFAVVSRDLRTGRFSTRRARHVVIAAGGKANIPPPFPQRHPRVLHSSQYSYLVPQILKDRHHPYKVAVFGGGQSAAEIFENLHSSYPTSQTRLVIKDTALRPSDDSPFVNEVFDPDRVTPFYNQACELRTSQIASNRATNYGVVRLELLERLYEALYMQRLRYPSEEEWPHRILSRRRVIQVGDARNDRVRLHLRDASKSYGEIGADEFLDVDLVIVACGYVRDSHEELLRGARNLMPGGDTEGKTFEAERDYRVRFEEGRVAQDAGVWLQGCCERTHGLSDTLLSILAVRAGELVQSVFGEEAAPSRNSTSQWHHANGVKSPETNGVSGYAVNGRVDGPV